MQKIDQQVTLEFKRPGAETTQMTVDGYVLVGWNLDEDGTKLPVVHTSEPPDEAGQDIAHAVAALAIAMERHPLPGVAVMGKLVRAAMSKGYAMLEAAAAGEVPEG